MDGALELERLLAEMPGVGRIEGLPQAWYWSPAPGFDYVDIISADRGAVFQFAMRDCFNGDVARAVLEFALANSDELSGNSKPIISIPGFWCAGLEFNVLGAVAPSADRRFTRAGSALDAVIVPVFPAYHFEFSGDETVEEAGIRYGRMLGTADLGRAPSPFLRMRYANSRTASRTVGADFQILPASFLVVELANMIDSPNSFMEIMNWQRRVILVEWSGSFVVTEGATVTRLTLAQVSAFIDSVLKVSP